MTTTTSKIVIKDILTNEYYCVACSANPKGYITSANDEGNPGDNDFPYWSDNINEAYDFDFELSANNEMQMNDLTNDGTRKPVIFKA